MIRTARSEDAAAIAAIYAPYVLETAISFELEPPTAVEMRARMKRITESYPWLVYEKDSQIVAYAYASPHRDRAVYRWSVETSVYVAQSERRRGLGRALYQALFEILRRQRLVNAYGGITLPNPGSVRLHESVGFTAIGVYREIGYKFGAWRDVGWWVLRLSEARAEPPEPIPFARLQNASI